MYLKEAPLHFNKLLADGKKNYWQEQIYQKIVGKCFFKFSLLI